jgi:hypothetical protein
MFFFLHDLEWPRLSLTEESRADYNVIFAKSVSAARNSTR